MPLKVATINVNGIRAAFKNGIAGWLSENSNIDVFALQEVRAETKDLVDLFEANPPAKGKWHFAHDAASAKGRAGVAIVSKTEPIAVRTTLGPDSFDSAGRWLEADFKVGSKIVHETEVSNLLEKISGSLPQTLLVISDSEISDLGFNRIREAAKVGDIKNMSLQQQHGIIYVR